MIAHLMRFKEKSVNKTWLEDDVPESATATPIAMKSILELVGAGSLNISLIICELSTIIETIWTTLKKYFVQKCKLNMDYIGFATNHILSIDFNEYSTQTREFTDHSPHTGLVLCTRPEVHQRVQLRGSFYVADNSFGGHPDY